MDLTYMHTFSIIVEIPNIFKSGSHCQQVKKTICAFFAPEARKTGLFASIPRQRLAALPAGFPLQSLARLGLVTRYARCPPMQSGWRREEKRTISRLRASSELSFPPGWSQS
jgi:hypothetical protein